MKEITGKESQKSGQGAQREGLKEYPPEELYYLQGTRYNEEDEIYFDPD